MINHHYYAGSQKYALDIIDPVDRQLSMNAGVFLLLAHIQQDSVLVAKGDKVTVGQVLAKIGNSGNTTQPHLHIQAMTNIDFLNANSSPVPILFNTNNKKSVFLKRNDILQGS